MNIEDKTGIILSRWDEMGSKAWGERSDLKFNKIVLCNKEESGCTAYNSLYEWIISYEYLWWKG